MSKYIPVYWLNKHKNEYVEKKYSPLLVKVGYVVGIIGMVYSIMITMS